MSITPTFQGEVQLAGWSESHNGGCKVTFWLADSADLDAFRALTVRKGNTAGQRLACVLVEIGDDEQPVQPPPVAQPEAPKGGPLAKLAGMWCESAAFASWLERTYTDTWAVSSVTEPESKRCATTLRILCGIDSRAQLDHDDKAATRFQDLIRLPYMQHIGTAQACPR